MKNVLTFLMLLLTLAVFAQDKNCSDFKTGEFKYVGLHMPEKIIRTATMQVETNPNTNIVVKTAIEWTSDCEYILTYREILNYQNDASDFIGEKIYCEIIEIHGDRIKVHAKSDRMDEVIEFIKTN